MHICCLVHLRSMRVEAWLVTSLQPQTTGRLILEHQAKKGTAELTSKLMERALRDAEQTSSDDDTNVTMVMEQKMASSYFGAANKPTDHPPPFAPLGAWRRARQSKWANGQLAKTGEKTGALPLGGCKLPIRIVSPA